MFTQRALATLRRQHGIITRPQALGAGVTQHAIRRLHAEGQIEQPYRGVLRHRATERTWHGDLLAACLACGAIASHRSAAALHRLDGFSEGRLEVTVPRGSRGVSGARVHQSTQLHLASATERQGVPVTGLARTVLDLGAVLSARQLDDVVDAVIRDRRLRYRHLYSVLALHSAPGRNGCGVLRAVLDRRNASRLVPLSSWSRMVVDLLVAHGVPTPELEYRVVDRNQEFVAQVDLAFPVRRLALELDSWRWHGGEAGFHRDKLRDRRLAAAGWTVLPVTWDQYVGDPQGLIADIRSALSASRAS